MSPVGPAPIKTTSGPSLFDGRFFGPDNGPDVFGTLAEVELELFSDDSLCWSGNGVDLILPSPILYPQSVLKFLLTSVPGSADRLLFFTVCTCSASDLSLFCNRGSAANAVAAKVEVFSGLTEMGIINTLTKNIERRPIYLENINQ